MSKLHLDPWLRVEGFYSRNLESVGLDSGRGTLKLPCAAKRTVTSKSAHRWVVRKALNLTGTSDCQLGL